MNAVVNAISRAVDACPYARPIKASPRGSDEAGCFTYARGGISMDVRLKTSTKVIRPLFIWVARIDNFAAHHHGAGTDAIHDIFDIADIASPAGDLMVAGSALLIGRYANAANHARCYMSEWDHLQTQLLEALDRYKDNKAQTPAIRAERRAQAVIAEQVIEGAGGYLTTIVDKLRPVKTVGPCPQPTLARQLFLDSDGYQCFWLRADREKARARLGRPSPLGPFKAASIA